MTKSRGSFHVWLSLDNSVRVVIDVRVICTVISYSVYMAILPIG
jgi:hypothetical protein